MATHGDMDFIRPRETAWPSPLLVEHLPARQKAHWWQRRGPQLLRLTAPLAYVDDVIGMVTVPEGFVTDGASIPRVFWSVIGCPFDACLRAAIVHDYLCQMAAFPRALCDGLFLRALADCGVGLTRRRMMYRAVRLFGWRHFGRTRNAGQ